MKWKQIGKELGERSGQLIKEYAGREVYIYAAGLFGERVFYAINRLTDWSVIAFVDKYKAGTTYHRLDVISMEELKKRINKDSLILLGLCDDIGKEIKEQINSFLDNKYDICKTYDEFMRRDFPVIAFYQYNKVMVHLLSCIVTERCTLRCEKCAIMLPYFKEIKEYRTSDIKKEIDLAFSKIDFVGNFTFTGGEPLLNADLEELCRYLAENYSDKIGTIKIITNGMLEPSMTLLDCMKQYGIHVDISDYTVTNEGLKERVQQITGKFRDSGVRTYLLSPDEWVDFGFETVNRTDESDETTTAFFDYCRTECRGFIDGKIWYCINARFAEQARGGQYDESNMLDLNEIGDELDDRIKIVEFDLGYNSRGYLEMCRHCNGGCDINTNYIEAGRQMRVKG